MTALPCLLSCQITWEAEGTLSNQRRRALSAQQCVLPSAGPCSPSESSGSLSPGLSSGSHTCILQDGHLCAGLFGVACLGSVLSVFFLFFFRFSLSAPYIFGGTTLLYAINHLGLNLPGPSLPLVFLFCLSRVLSKPLAHTPSSYKVTMYALLAQQFLEHSGQPINN